MSVNSLGSRAVIGKFYEALAASDGSGPLGQLAMRIDSDQASETYKWLGMVPAMREWVGGRQAKGLRDNGLTITNKTFESTIDIPVDWMRRDKTGQIDIRVAEMANRAVTHKWSLLSTLILNGATGLCYDGQYFFDTDHTEGDNTTSQSNKITFDISDAGTGGTSTLPTASTMQRAILSGVSQIMGFLDDQNEPFNEMAKNFVVMASPALMGPVMAAVANPVIDSGATNLIANQSMFSIQPMINPRLSTWTDKVAVFRTDGAAKPFILQLEEDVSVSAKAEGSEYEFDNNAHQYGAKYIGNVAYGLWQHACLVTMQA